MAQLREFYRDVNRALNYSTPLYYWFSPYAGFCDNLDSWYDYDCKRNRIRSSRKELLRLRFKMRDQFMKANLSRVLPFNQYGNKTYVDEAFNNSIWKNEKRLAWLRDHV